MSFVPLHHTAAGESAAPPVILLHGFAGDRETWTNIQTALASRRRSLAFDLPGHGRERDRRPVGNAKVLAEAVISSLDALGLERVHLAGHSLGGAVAAVIATRIPERVASLTLLAPGGFGPEINHRLLRRLATAREEADLAPAIEEMFGFAAKVPRFIARHLAEQRRDPEALTPLGEILETILDGPVQRTFPPTQFADPPFPVSVLWGTQDRVVPTRHCHKLPGLIATHVFEGVGHMVHLEIPTQTTRLILRNMATEG